ncbi:MAG TPA: hypothetical protein VHE61_11255 [Opitutaceae bacterium]|nr:hypothetical protein [Opitutaceae bacterium]
MKTAAAAPLADVTCCQHVEKFHPATCAEAVGMPQPGEILDDRFLITEVISRSGMAMIFRAQDTHNRNADVAIKVPYLQLGKSKGVTTVLLTEGLVAAG